MVGGTLRSIYSAADETEADLDRLNQKALSRRNALLSDFRAAVASLDVGISSPDNEPVQAPLRDERGGDRPRVTASDSDHTPFVPLPQRTTHGGPWGPAMVEKLTNIALEKASRRW